MKEFKEVLCHCLSRIAPVVFAFFATCTLIRVSSHDYNVVLCCSVYLVVFAVVYAILICKESSNY